MFSMFRNWKLTTVLGVILAAALTGAIQEVLRHAAGDFTRDNLSIIGDYIDWRWSTAVTLGVIFLGAWLSYSGVSRDITDTTGSRIERSDRSIRVISDNISWVFEGWREWPDGTRKIEVSEECPVHNMPLLHWAAPYKRPDPIDKAYGRMGTFRGVKCAGPDGDSGHLIMPSESKNLDVARRVALARLTGNVNAVDYDRTSEKTQAPHRLVS